MILVYSDEKYESMKAVDNDKATRGFMHVGGWLLENVGEKETRANLLIEMDLRGNIPHYVQKNTNVIQAGQMNKLAKTIDKYLADLQK